MNTTRRWPGLSAAALGLALAGLSGCQTYVPGASLTLPSGRYLDHPPQFIPPSPAFPLTRELARQEEINRQVPGSPALAPLPPAVPSAAAPAAAAPAPAPIPAPPPMPEKP